MVDGEDTWKGYPMGKAKCHCGADIYISGRGTPKGWSGIECCSCGNLIENCACGGLLPSKEVVEKIKKEVKICSDCINYERKDVYEKNRCGQYVIRNKWICTVTGHCDK